MSEQGQSLRVVRLEQRDASRLLILVQASLASFFVCSLRISKGSTKKDHLFSLVKRRCCAGPRGRHQSLTVYSFRVHLKDQKVFVHKWPYSRSNTRKSPPDLHLDHSSCGKAQISPKDCSWWKCVWWKSGHGDWLSSCVWDQNSFILRTTYVSRKTK